MPAVPRIPRTVQALTHWPLAARRALVGVFTDIDDTLTTEGAITPEALAALADLKAAGLAVIPITGRHVGWCEALMAGGGAPPWPVDALVAENGALALVPAPDAEVANLPNTPDGRRPLVRRYQEDAATRHAHQARMEQVAAQVAAAVPGVQRARDAGGRETDLAFDYHEFARLSPAEVRQVLAVLERAGMHTSVSSIHIHGSFGGFDKWLGARWIVRELFQRDLAQELERWVFVGDSGNDQAMFQHFTHSVGVANIHRCADQLRYLPRYVTPGERGAGFAQVAQALLSVRAH